MANLSFNPNEVEPDAGRAEPIPEGRYLLQVVDSDVAPNKKNTGTMLKLVYEVADGPLKGRKVFDQLNIEHENVTAQEIAQRRLSALCKAAGITSAISDSQELHYQPFEADVEIEPERTDPASGKTYSARNNVKRFHFDGAAAPAAKPAAKPATTAKPAAAATGSRPWQKSA